MHTQVEREGNELVKGSSMRWYSQRETETERSIQILINTRREKKERNNHGDARYWESTYSYA